MGCGASTHAPPRTSPEEAPAKDTHMPDAEMLAAAQTRRSDVDVQPLADEQQPARRSSESDDARSRRLTITNTAGAAGAPRADLPRAPTAIKFASPSQASVRPLSPRMSARRSSGATPRCTSRPFAFNANDLLYDATGAAVAMDAAVQPSLSDSPRLQGSTAAALYDVCASPPHKSLERRNYSPLTPTHRILTLRAPCRVPVHAPCRSERRRATRPRCARSAWGGWTQTPSRIQTTAARPTRTAPSSCTRSTARTPTTPPRVARCCAPSSTGTARAARRSRSTSSTSCRTT